VSNFIIINFRSFAPTFYEQPMKISKQSELTLTTEEDGCVRPMQINGK